jgi:ribosomal protein S18 acetylase RimI-like enzyme
MIGTAQQAEPDPQVTSELYQIHVDPEHFRRGIGRGLHTTGVDFWLAGKVRAARV